MSNGRRNGWREETTNQIEGEKTPNKNPNKSHNEEIIIIGRYCGGEQRPGTLFFFVRVRSGRWSIRCLNGNNIEQRSIDSNR